MKRKIFIFQLLSLFTISLSAQNGIVRGRVYNVKTNEPLEFAKILIQGTTIVSTSDLDGNFIFTGVKPGFKKLVVSLLGYQTTTSAEFQVQGNQTVFIDVSVPETSLALNEVVVTTGSNIKKIESPISTLTVGVQEIEKTAGANRDVSKVVQTLPGVGVTDPNRNDLIVRGGGPSENAFYLDGIEIPVINHFATQGSSGGSVGVINPDFVREINFYTGAFPANRLNALSSVMDIRQKDGSNDRVHAKFSIGASDAAITLDGPINAKSTFIVSARQSYLQFLFKAIGLPFLPTYNDFQIKYKYQFDKKNELTFIGIGAIDDMVLNTYDDPKKPPTESQSYILSFLPTYKQWNYTFGAVYKHFSDNFFDTWVLSRNMLRNKNFKYKDNNENLYKTSDYTSDEAENKLRYERNYPDLPVKVIYGLGLKYAHYTNDTYRKIIQNNTATDLNYNTGINLWGYNAFAQASKKLFYDMLRLSFGVNFAGVNYNKNMSNPFNHVSPRFSLSYAFTDKVDLNANIGRYTLQPAYTTLGYKGLNGELANKNEQLRYTVSNQYIAGVEYRPMTFIKFSLEGFYKGYEHYPFSVADGLTTASKGTTFGQIGDEKIVSTGKGRAYGVELLGKVLESKNLNVAATYTYFRSEFTDLNGKYILSSWDTKHLLNIIASYKLPRNLNVAMRWRFVGGAPYTPIDLNNSSKKEFWDIANQPLLDYTKFNSLRLKSSHQLDIRVDKEMYFKSFVLNLYADVQNVYNFKSQSAPIYTNLKPNPVDENDVNVDPSNSSNYLLRSIDNINGTILPTVGIIIKI